MFVIVNEVRTGGRGEGGVMAVNLCGDIWQTVPNKTGFQMPGKSGIIILLRKKCNFK